MLKYDLKNMGSLAKQFPAKGLFAAWLGQEELAFTGNATAELQSVAGRPVAATKAPLWQVAEFAERLPAEWRTLPSGPGVVVTGQQPGYLGGPLYSLFKIATAVVLAAELTESGRPTVPVFWSGDDDDDLVEALATVGWTGRTNCLFSSPDRESVRKSRERRAVLAGLGPEVWASPVLAALSTRGGGVGLPARLQQVLTKAVAQGQDWGEGQAALIAAVFEGSPLVVIRGNEPNLHGAAAPFYAQLAGRLPELATLARERGAALSAAGFHAQINERSLGRPLFRVVGQERQPAPEFTAQEARVLRPGVMLRSPLQDWLLQPTAVVVGPGEMAYLRQLDPVYKALGIDRSPLVPRLSGWVVPDGQAGARVWPLLRPPSDARVPDPDQLADQVVAVARREIETVLQSELGVAADRASELAAGRARRFRKGVRTMLDSEVARRKQDRLAGVPQWVLPEGQRQERALGILSALDLWGDELVAAVRSAAREHLASGRRGLWQEWALIVPERTVGP